ncbi:hypothetical protein AC30_3495 [Escherichia coli 3-020-07_S3_C2]|nr:hypothetical protein AC30_3495 [Escherichia coli 3-020-07_S3_C2]
MIRFYPGALQSAEEFSPEALREIIAEIACCHPSTSILLRNKW